jgi:HEAT repeat protein
VARFDTLLADLTSGEDGRASAAVTALASADAPPIERLSKLLEASDPDQRWWATAALAGIDHPQARRGLLQSLADPDLFVRQCAALGLREQPTEQAIADLLRAMQSPDPMLSRLAADALAAIGEPAAPALIQALRSEVKAGLRVQAARALASAQVPDAIPALFEALDDPSYLVAYWAEEALQRMNVGMLFFSP